MVYKYDEIIAVLQTDGRLLQEKKEELKIQRYNQRFSGIYRDSTFPDKSNEAEQRRVLENMTPEQFEKKRLEQAMQLYSAYKSNRTIGSIVPGNNFAARDWIIRTSIDAVRHVTGKHPERGIYNTDILYLDERTIFGIEAIAWAQDQIADKRIEISGITPIQLLDVVDDLVATEEIIDRNFTPRGKHAPTARVLATETNLIKRSVGFKRGKNVYKIEDYSVNVEQMLSNKSNIFKKMYRFFREKWKEFNRNPNQPATPNRFGDQEIYLDDGERG